MMGGLTGRTLFAGFNIFCDAKSRCVDRWNPQVFTGAGYVGTFGRFLHQSRDISLILSHSHNDQLPWIDGLRHGFHQKYHQTLGWTSL